MEPFRPFLWSESLKYDKTQTFMPTTLVDGMGLL
jgi:hypothetical protein